MSLGGGKSPGILTDVNGKVIAAGAKVVVNKYGRLRTGTVRWTKSMVTTGEVYIKEQTAQRVAVDLDELAEGRPPSGYSRRRFRDSQNYWEGSGAVLVVVTEAPHEQG